MKPYTLDNNLTFGYDQGTFNFVDVDQSQFWCKYARATRAPGNFKEECIRTAVLLGEQAAELNRVPTILLSGGLDSQIMTRAFMEAGVPFEHLTFRFPDGLNTHETVLVEQLCAQQGLKPAYYDMDIRKFAASDEAREMFIESNCYFFEMVPHMKLMAEIWERGGMPILGNGDVYLERVGKEWLYVEFEYILAWFRFAIKRGILGGLAFFQHTPEITLSMLNEPKLDLTGMGRNRTANVLLPNSRAIKYKIYQQYWPELPARMKYNGGERLHKVYHELAEPLRNGFNGKFTLPYAEFKALISPSSSAAAGE